MKLLFDTYSYVSFHHLSETLNVTMLLPSALPVVVEALHSGSSTMITASSFSSTDAVLAVYDWTHEHSGPFGVATFAAAHCASVVVCFPATVLFEIAAGFAFGFALCYSFGFGDGFDVAFWFAGTTVSKSAGSTQSFAFAAADLPFLMTP